MKSGVLIRDVITVYCSLIRSILEYSCPVWHSGLTCKESSDIEGVQKRVLKIIWPDLKYKDSLERASLDRLDLRRERFVRETFKLIKEPGHVLHDLLPMKINRSLPTRNDYPYALPRHNTDRYLKSFLSYCIKKCY